MKVVAVLAEKPSVARDIAAALGSEKKGDGFFYGSGYAVTWAIGHLVTLAEPHQIRPEWKGWRAATLPMLPSVWPLVAIEESRKQLDVVRRVLLAPNVDHIVCATDAGREGELIFRTIYEYLGVKRAVSRLWISSLLPETIREGFRKLRPSGAFDGLADAARGRSRADWLVGMNLTRAYTVAHGDLYSVGRVQTPTLAMIVERELSIRAFVPESYVELVATFDAHGGSFDATFVRADAQGAKKPKAEQKRLPPDGVEAAEILRQAQQGPSSIESLIAETKRTPPPELYDLTELQRHANRIFGWSAKRTLDLAQSLYEEHKLLTYPRTDSRHLSTDVASTLPEVVRAIQGPYAPLLSPETGQKPLGKRFVDDAKVTDHHAIIPTTRAPKETLPPDQRKLYDLVCRRLLACWQGDYVYRATNVVVAARGAEVSHRFHAAGTTILELGHKKLDYPRDKTKDKKASNEEVTLPPLEPGEAVVLRQGKVVPKKTEPPKRLTDATLLSAMESAGRSLDDEEAARAMRDSGLGTPATRASIIETLLDRGYVERQGKALLPTDKGVGLVGLVHPKVKSPVLTGEWEARLKRVERGQEALEGFLQGIEGFVKEVVGDVLGAPSAPARREFIGAQTISPASSRDETPRGGAPPSLPPASAPAVVDLRPRRAPIPPEGLRALIEKSFGFPGFRPYQEDVCRAVLGGRDVLLVMPTGAGKSLCYQLPGIARGGTTLVVSPLIALMEDQAQQLEKRGFSAERIHSGRDRAALREASRAYLRGDLDFLFIAPERLAVPGFPEMLARRPPVLVAIDEAHCISQWGHDFRPEYRMLGQRLPLLRPAPVIALTATATPTVQDDIVKQLGLDDELRMIRGFRRTNIAIEVVETTPGERARATAKLLTDPRRRPAIVYAPTRKDAESLAEALSSSFSTTVYHAGKGAAERDRAQTAFLQGEVEVVVATIAFGMGIDKANVRTVVHAALPASVEGYYQEIGRAGRDGLPSRAVLFHSYVDRRTHEFFHGKDYPPTDVLMHVFEATPSRAGASIAKDDLRERLRNDGAIVDPQIFEKTLEKLWIFGGVRVSPDEEVARGVPTFRVGYEAQRDHKLASLVEMARFAESNACRMLRLVQHFGDAEDGGAPCGICDVCSPSESIAASFRDPTEHERHALTLLIESLADRDGEPTGRLFRDKFEGTAIDRRAFEHLLGGLSRAGLVRVERDSFEKDGRTIDFERAYLTSEGRRMGARSLGNVAVVARASKALPKPRKRAEKAARSAVRAKKSAAPRAAPSAGAGLERFGAVVTALRTWRLAEAKKKKLPAFRILSDRVLTAIAEAGPTSVDDLLNVAGFGPRGAEKYGSQILRIVEETRRRG